MIEIRKAVEEDKAPIWEIIKSVIASGDTYIFYPDTPREKMLAYWFAADKHTYVALSERQNRRDVFSQRQSAGFRLAHRQRRIYGRARSQRQTRRQNNG